MSQQPKQKKKKKSRAKKAPGVNSMPANSIKSMPAAIGYVANQNTFSISPKVQQLADQDPKNGVRCAGSALINQAVSSYSSYSSTTPYPNGYTGALSSPSTTAGQGYSFLAPGEIDPRLASLVACYQYYAFRRLCLKYIPAIGTTFPGTVFLAISKDPEQAVRLYANVGGTTITPTTGTIQDIMDTDPAVATTIWQPALVEFEHRGVKLWETFQNTDQPILSRLQAAIVCLYQGPAPNAANVVTFYGNLYLEYEIDLYVPGPPLPTN
jgi:hypothetical protein